MLAYVFVLFAVLVRFMPHPWLFTPVAGSLLFFGARGSRRQLWAPLALLVASDLILTKFVYHYPLLWDQFVVFAWYAAILWLGTKLGSTPKMLRVIAAALTSSASFFLITNFTSWIAASLPYPRTFGGLMTSYELGLPFFRHTLEGDLLFSVLMFATPALLHALSGADKETGTAVTA